jgi:hypothetical protein
MENPPIQSIVSKIPQFMVVPTGYSATSSVVIVLVLFILYIVFIGYISCYKLKFYPNMFMFWNFMSTGNDAVYQTEFENYIRMVMADTNAQITQSGVIAPSKTESFVSGSSNNLTGNALTGNALTGNALTDNPFINRWAELQPILRSWYTHIQMAWNKFMLTSFVNGKTIKVTRV